MLADGIKIGDRVEITGKTAQGGKYFLSRVEEVLDGERIVVCVPISYGVLVKLDLEKEYYFLFFNDNGIYRYSAKIIRYFKEDGFNLMQVILVSEGEKVQRRAFFRHSTLMPIKLIGIDENTETDRSMLLLGSGVSEGIIKDVGGGGIRFVTNCKLKEGDCIYCGFLVGDEFMQAEATVLNKQEMSNNASFKFQYRASFNKMTGRDKEKIVQYIFLEQRRLLKKNLFTNRG